MANQELNASMITNMALRVLVNNLVAANKVNREYNDYFAVEGAKIGDTLNIRKPARYLGGEGPAIITEDFIETSVPLQLNRQPNVGLQFTDKELLLNIDLFSKRIISPAVANIANKVDAAVLSLYSQIPFFVGTLGSDPGSTNDLSVYLKGKAQLANNAAPVDDMLYIVITPNNEATIVNALRGLFQSAEQIKRQYEKGVMGYVIGAEWAMDQNVQVQTVGAVAGTPVVNGAGQTGSSLITNGWNTNIIGVLNAGDIIQVANVNQTNPQSHVSVGVLQMFVVTQTVNTDGSGNCTIPIFPPITPSGAYQTTDSSPASGAAITVYGTASGSFANIAGKQSAQSMIWHRDAFTLACADLPLPKNMEMAARATDPQLGLSIRFLRGYDIRTGQFISRLDLLFGVAAMRQELACRYVN